MTKTRSFIAIIVVMFTLIVPVVAGAVDSAVYHVTGRVSFFDGSKIVVDGKEFLVLAKAAYLLHSKRNRASFEDKASQQSLRIGDSVILHINGTIADKIIIEEWKR